MIHGDHDAEAIAVICEDHGRRRDRLMDIVLDVHRRYGRVSPELMDMVAAELNVPRVDVESIVTFYSFLDSKPRGRFIIRLCNDVIDHMKGVLEVAAALERELGITFGETTEDGMFTLEWTAFIGMGDQAPAALINEVVVTELSADKVPSLIREIREHKDPRRLVTVCGDGHNAHPLVRSMVRNSVQLAGEVLLSDFEADAGLAKALTMEPEQVIDMVTRSGLQGRGGAGFSTGMKWQFTRQAEGLDRWVICNADEGEPGTFKDRVLLTERAELMLAGMTIAGFALGAENGLIYLRAEYEFLQPYLRDVIDARRRRGLLGSDILGREGFDFDVVIRMGAGAYICGEETALISSVEGKRGDPKLRPPFPAQRGYMTSPTSVNNVETLCCVPRILDRGAAWFDRIGTEKSKGTKLFSVSGDCRKPGVYELPFGVTLRELLELCEAEATQAVQVGGPSGQMVSVKDFDRTLSFEDLPGGGSIMVFDHTRDVIDVTKHFVDFFTDESCGHCTPCRVGNVLMQERIDLMLAGQCRPSDLEYLQDLGKTMQAAARCGLGQTAPNPVLTSLDRFREVYEKRVDHGESVLLPRFRIHTALEPAEAIAGRDSIHFPGAGEERS